MHLLILFVASCYAVAPPISSVTFQPVQLPAHIGNGNEYTTGECGSTAFQQSPINIDTTKAIHEVFEEPLTTKGWSQVPTSATFSNKHGDGRSVFFSHKF